MKKIIFLCLFIGLPAYGSCFSQLTSCQNICEHQDKTCVESVSSGLGVKLALTALSLCQKKKETCLSTCKFTYSACKNR